MSPADQEKRFRSVLEQNILKPNELRLLKTLAANPGLTAVALSKKMGYQHPSAWNMQLGGLCKKLETMLWPAPQSKARRNEAFYSGILTDGEGLSFTLKPHLQKILQDF
jgi:hypothetical protein